MTYERDYMIVDTGPWIFGRRVVVPTSLIKHVDGTAKTVASFAAISASSVTSTLLRVPKRSTGQPPAWVLADETIRRHEGIAGAHASKRTVTNSTLRPRSDLGAAVIDGAKRGDQDAFALLVRHYDPGLRALAYRLLGDPDRMDDALQEAYVKAFRSLSSFRGESRLGTWLYRIVYNACLDELKRGQNLIQLPLDNAAEPSDPRPDVAEAVAGRSRLAEALAELTLEERAAVLLVDAQGFDYRSAGEVLEVPEGTVASRLHRARAALRRALEERGEGVLEG